MSLQGNLKKKTIIGKKFLTGSSFISQHTPDNIWICFRSSKLERGLDTVVHNCYHSYEAETRDRRWASSRPDWATWRDPVLKQKMQAQWYSTSLACVQALGSILSTAVMETSPAAPNKNWRGNVSAM